MIIINRALELRTGKLEGGLARVLVGRLKIASLFAVFLPSLGAVHNYVIM